MIRVKMTPNLKERPPKILGPFTLKRLLWTAIGLAVAIPVAILIPLDITARIVLAAVSAIPFIVIGWFPETETSPTTIIKAVFKTKVLSPGKRTHDGNSGYYEKRSEIIKVKRTAERKGFK